jgi:hypothetical protein
MFYVIDSNYRIVSNCNNKLDIESGVEKHMNGLEEVDKVHKLDSFDQVVKSGYYYTVRNIDSIKKIGEDDESTEFTFTLRKYTLQQGYIYNTLPYELIDVYRVYDYNGSIKEDILMKLKKDKKA